MLARVLYEEQMPHGNTPWDRLDEVTKYLYVGYVEAVLEALDAMDIMLVLRR